MGTRSPLPLPPRHLYFRHLLRSVAIAFSLIGLSLAIGIGGYLAFGRMELVDAVVEASMILAGMGPVMTKPGSSAALKWFSSAYALFSGVMLLSSVSVMLAPVIHRFLHRFHLETEERTR